MKKIAFILLFIPLNFIYGQPYAPAAGQPGSTAIKFDDERFVAWATGVEVIRGYINISDTTAVYNGTNRASFGEPDDVLGEVTENPVNHTVSLGDSGIAILTFDKPITNGSGYDFAVFENGHSDNFLELAHVEVSSDGIHFVRFPSHSTTQTKTQVASFGLLDPIHLYNLAGKYRVGYGTPFDLEELKDEPFLDVQKITHVKIIDVVGSLGEKGTKDSYGNKINDPFPTPFHSGGFDLSGVGVIHQYDEPSSLSNNELNLVSIYAANGNLYIDLSNVESNELKAILYNAEGRKTHVAQLHSLQNNEIKLQLPEGIYFVNIVGDSSSLRKKVFLKSH